MTAAAWKIRNEALEHDSRRRVVVAVDPDEDGLVNSQRLEKCRRQRGVEQSILPGWIYVDPGRGADMAERLDATACGCRS